MKKYLILLCILASQATAQTQTTGSPVLAARIQTASGLLEFLTQPTAGGVYTIGGGVYTLPPNTFTQRDRLSGTQQAPIVIQGEGIGKTIIECPNVCYFEPNSWVIWRDLTIRGAINSRHLRHWSFQRVRFDDPNAIGWTQRVLFKTTGAPTPYSNPVDIGAGPILFENCEFRPHDSAADTTLDFVATQGVQILDSIFEKCARGCWQAKGGSGILEPYIIARNWIQDAGQRGIYLGGGANPEFFDPPLNQAQAEFGAAEVYDNIVEGGNTCFTVGTVSGPIDFHHNLCIAQSGWQFRMIDENQNPATAEGVRNVTIRDSIMLDWIPPQWPNTNVLASAGTVQWHTITMRNLLFNYPSRQYFWGWPYHVDNPMVKENIIDSADVEYERDADGKPRVIDWAEHGPRPGTHEYSFKTNGQGKPDTRSNVRPLGLSKRYGNPTNE